MEPPLDDLSLDEAQFVLAPSCCSLDSPGPRPETEEESGEEVFLSAYDDLSPLLEPKLPSWEGPGSEEEKVAGSGRQEASGQAEGEQALCEGGVDEGEPGSRRDNGEEAEGRPESGVEGREATEEGAEAEGSQKVTDSLKEGCGEETEETEATAEEYKGQQEGERTEEAKGVGETGGEQAKDKGKEGKTERQEGAEEGDEAQVAAGKDSEHEAQENQIAEESWEVVHKQEGEGGREDEVKGQRGDEGQEAGEDHGDGEDSRIPETAAEGGAGPGHPRPGTASASSMSALAGQESTQAETRPDATPGVTEEGAAHGPSSPAVPGPGRTAGRCGTSGRRCRTWRGP